MAKLMKILADFPPLTAEDIRAVVAFAAASTEEDLPAYPCFSLFGST